MRVGILLEQFVRILEELRRLFEHWRSLLAYLGHLFEQFKLILENPIFIRRIAQHIRTIKVFIR